VVIVTDTVFVGSDPDAVLGVHKETEYTGDTAGGIET